jgi:hypothetical protein
MPSKYTLKTLPIPDNKNVRLREVKEHYLIVKRFRGGSPSKEVISSKKEQLEKCADEFGVRTIQSDAFVYQV